MRYYVLCVSDYDGIAPYVVAEVVRDEINDDQRETTMAAALAGDRAMILTRSELLADAVSREALEAWENRDDSEFYSESLAIQAEETIDRAARRLRLVGAEEPPKRTAVQLPAQATYREVLFQARGLRTLSRVLVERAREQRAAHRGIRSHDGPRAIGDGN